MEGIILLEGFLGTPVARHKKENGQGAWALPVDGSLRERGWMV